MLEAAIYTWTILSTILLMVMVFILILQRGVIQSLENDLLLIQEWMIDSGRYFASIHADIEELQEKVFPDENEEDCGCDDKTNEQVELMVVPKVNI